MRTLAIPVAILAAVVPVAAAGLPPQAATPPARAAVETIMANKPGAAGARRLRRGEKKTFELTEAEVNEFIAQWIQAETDKKKPREVTVKSGTVHLEEGRVIQADAVARVDPSAMKMLKGNADSVVTRGVKNYLSIDNSVSVRVMASSAKGKIFVKVLGAKVKDIPIPESLIHSILEMVGQKQRPPLDFNRLFPLPNGIDKVEILPGRLRISLHGV